MCGADRARLFRVPLRMAHTMWTEMSASLTAQHSQVLPILITMGLKTLLTGGEERYTKFDDPYKYDKDDCVSCKVLGRLGGICIWRSTLTIDRVDSVCVSRRLHVFLGHETIERDTKPDRDEQIQV